MSHKFKISLYSLCRDSVSADDIMDQGVRNGFTSIYCFSGMDYYKFLDKVINECENEYAVVCHDDVVFQEKFYKKIEEAIRIINTKVGKANWGVVGNAGIEMITHRVIKYVDDPCGMVDDSMVNAVNNPPVLVSADGNTLLLNILNLREKKISLAKTMLSGFHMYDAILVMECYKNRLICMAHPNLFVYHKSSGNQEAFQLFIKSEMFLDYIRKNFNDKVFYTINGEIRVKNKQSGDVSNFENLVKKLFNSLCKDNLSLSGLIFKNIYYSICHRSGWLHPKLKFIIFSPKKFIKKYFRL